MDSSSAEFMGAHARRVAPLSDRAVTAPSRRREGARYCNARRGHA